jgi:dihydrofolate reductase
MVTIDGFFAGDNGELDWFVQSEELDRFATKLLDSVDTILYGRLTYQMMAGYWPRAHGGFADRTNQLPKLVFSSTLDETPWGSGTMRGRSRAHWPTRSRSSRTNPAATS